MKKIVLIVVVLVAVFVTFGIFSGLLLHRNDDNWGSFYIGDKDETATDINQSATLDADGLDRIVVDTVSSEVILYTVDGDDIEVTLSGVSYSRAGAIELVTDIRGDVAYIEVKYPNGNSYKTFRDFFRNFNFNDISSFRFDDGELEIGVPTSYNEQLSISTVSGNITDSGDDLPLDKIKISTVSGNATIDNFLCEDIDLDTVSGDFDIYMESINGSFNGVSGDLIISGEVLVEEFKFDSVSGDGSFIVEDEINLEIDFDSVSGDFKCDYPVIIGSQDFNSLNAKIGNGEGKLKVDTVSGDVSID